MALSKSALKAKFVTGAIPTQTDFTNLIDGMLSMPLGGGTGDTTIGFGNGDSTDRLYVKSLRYICTYERSYFLIGAWDDEIRGNYLVAVICFQGNAVSGADFNITYHLLDKTDRARFESEVGDINTADEIDLINNIKDSGWTWFNITQPTNNNPSPRTILLTNITYRVYPVLQNDIWNVGYAFAMDDSMGGLKDLYVYRCTGNSQTKWTAIDSVVADDLENASKFSKKLLWSEGGDSSDNSNFKTCEIGTSESAIFEVVEVLYDTKRIKIPVSIRFLSVGISNVDNHSIWDLNTGANIIKVQNNWNNILNNWEDSNIYDLVIEFRNDCFINRWDL